jgi:hypothetical protein
MGSVNPGWPAVLGGQALHEAPEPEGEPRPDDALRALMPNAALEEIFDFSRAFAQGIERLINTRHLNPMFGLLEYQMFLIQHPEIWFPLQPALLDEPGQGFAGELDCTQTEWGLPDEAVLRMVAAELGLDPAGSPRKGILGMRARYFRERDQRYGEGAGFALLKRALLKLSDCQHDDEIRPPLVEWAQQFRP